MSLRAHIARQKEKMEDIRISSYVSSLLSVTYGYTARSRDNKARKNIGYTFGELPVKDTVCWQQVYKDDEIIESLKERNNKEREDKYEGYIERFNFFKNELKYVHEKLNGQTYFKLLEKLWIELYRLKASLSESYTDFRMTNPFDEKEQAQCTQSRLKREKISESYETTIKEELRWLDKKIPGLKEKCLKKFNADISGCISQLMFYKNELEPKGVLNLNIRDCESFGVPYCSGEIVDDYYDSNDYIMSEDKAEKRNNAILRIWKECNINIKKPSYLYKYQKQIIDECDEKTLISAVESNLFPDAVIRAALSYAETKKYIDKLPYLIWVKNKIKT